MNSICTYHPALIMYLFLIMKIWGGKITYQKSYMISVDILVCFFPSSRGVTLFWVVFSRSLCCNCLLTIRVAFFVIF